MPSIFKSPTKNPATEISASTGNFPSLSGKALRHKLSEVFIITADESLGETIIEHYNSVESCTFSILSFKDFSQIPVENLPSLVILDLIESPKTIETKVSLIRGRSAHTPIKILGLLDRSNVNDLENYLKTGIDDWASKPLLKPELINRIDFLLKEYNKEACVERFVQQSELEKKHHNELLSAFSHDLKNPIISIRGLSQFLLDPEIGGKVDDMQKEMIHGIHQASLSLMSMAGNLMDLSLFESGNQHVDFKDHDITKLVNTVYNQARANASEKGIKLFLLSEDFPPQFKFDRNLISRVITNGLNNAVKFGNQNSTVTLLLRVRNNQVILEIDNDGKTIPTEEFEKLFKPFGRTSITPTGEEKSTGLGLAICKRIMDAHKGTITLKNITNRGVRFIMELPIDH